jgi:cholesterol transport system auxiliary component
MRLNITSYSKLLCITVSALIVSSCSLFSPVKVVAPTKYMLNITPPYVPAKKMHRTTLLVLMPETLPVYNTTQMAYSIKPHQVAYFSKNEWAETPSQMFQPLLVQTLRNTHHFRAIATAPFIGHYDYVLSIQILQLQQNFTCYPARLMLKVSAQLVKVSTNRIIATQLFSIEQPMAARAPYAGVFAANHATENVLRQIASFSIAHTH